MAGHWADAYVGLPGEGANPCWLLVRRVWAARAGLVMDRYDTARDAAQAFEREGRKFTEVPLGTEQPLDAVIMFTDVRCGLAWKRAAAHIGVVVEKGLVLHVKRDSLSMIEPIASLDVARVLRP